MWQPVLMINGYIIFVLGAMMLLPSAAVQYFTGTPDMIFLRSAVFSMFMGGALFFTNYGKITSISVLQGYLITVLSWFFGVFVAAIPLYGNGEIKTISDAIFEAASGITATGATILQHIEEQPKSVLLWRSMLNSLGGIGIVIFAVALMPFLGIGGMNLFKKENSDTEEKFLPKLRDIAKDIIIVYITLNIICAVLLKWAGMNWFDAIAHALSTVCTGGFSTKSTSIAFFDNPLIELIVALFMILGALPLTYFVIMSRKRNFSTIIANPQVNTMLKLLVFYILFFSLFYAYEAHISFTKAFRVISFNIVSAVTTTGFTSSNYLNWGPWAVALIFFFTLHGGCTGSTSGSIKIFRWQVIAAFFKKNAINSLSPNQVAVIKTGDKVISDNIVSSVFILVLSFLAAIIFFTLIISLTGVDYVTALGAVAGTITSFGPGLTPLTGPVGNYAGFAPFVKLILAFIMVLGRLEVITVLVLFSKLKRL